MKKIFHLLLLILIIQLVSVFYAYAQADFKEISQYFKKTALPGERITITLRLIYNGPFLFDDFYPAAFMTVHGDATFELYPPVPVPIFRFNRKESKSISFDIIVPHEEGTYSVSFALFRTADDSMAIRVYGLNPITIGTPGEALNCHPSILNMGTLHEGRFMYPIPVKVRYKIFYPDRLGNIQPWSLRVYTDNANKFKGLKGTVKQLSPGGLVHSSGKYTIRLKFWVLNWGPEAHNTGWDATIQGPPPVDNDIFWKGVLLDESTPGHPVYDHDRKAWLNIPDYVDMTTENDTWRRAVGQFQYDGQFLNPTNTTGDFQLSSQPDPFDFYLAVEIGPTSVKGKYNGRLILELFSP
ncbi:hypothetical protein J7L67_07210 [bacterium]|nr:hypothetical protein [bacterium]